MGHSSTSISAALGMSIAAQLHGEEHRQVVAVIGDGALSGGLAFEGLNNACINPNNLLIILNDNNMAIDPIRGGLSEFLTNIHFSPTYNKARYRAYKLLDKWHLMSDTGRKRMIRFTNSLKSLRIKSQENNLFEGLNIRYFGPVDGHDVIALVSTLKEIIQYKGPKVLHTITMKGKGYEPAEREASLWHAPGVFDVETGQRPEGNNENKPPLFQEVFGETLLELAQQNESIVGITPAMPSGCSMTIMQQEMPERTFDVGIAEGHAVTFSAGMAKDGLMPFCNIYSSFMQRAIDNVIHDVALQNLNVVFCLDRAGIVGSDGATHHGQFDLAYFRYIPNMTIASPYDEHELRHMMYTAQLPKQGPFVIRYPRGRGYESEWRVPMQSIEVGKGRCLRKGTEIAVLSIGPIGHAVKDAIDSLERAEGKVAHYDMRFLKPIDELLLHEVGKQFKEIITVEDGTIYGGLGSTVIEFMNDHGYDAKVLRLGIPDQFVEHGTQSQLYHLLGIDSEGIAQKIKEKLNH